MTTPGSPGSDTKDDLNLNHKIAAGNAGSGRVDPHPKAGIHPADDIQTSIGQDIGNFFRVLFAFISGLWNRDFADFELLSSVYFPPLPPEQLPQDRPLTPQEDLRQRVDEMRRTVADPNSPQREMSTRDIANHYTRGLPRNATFEEIVEVFLPFEGGLNLNEPRGAKANYGINSAAHPDIDVTKLTRAEAIQIYRKDYWDAIKWQINEHVGQDQLSGAVKLIAFDASANHGLTFANKILHESYKEAGGKVEDMPAIMIAKRRAEYARLVNNDRETYGQYAAGWESRMKQLETKLKAFEDVSQRFDMRTPTDVLLSMPPVDIKKFATTSGFGIREHPVHGDSRVHTGIDIATPIGTPLQAASNATVAYAGQAQGYGNMVALHLGNGVYNVYAHLNSMAVKTRDTVTANQVFAHTGNTGVGTGAHLHHEIWIQRGNIAYTVDPEKAWGKNLLDPAVQNKLIQESQQMAPGFSTVSNAFSARVPVDIREAAIALTAPNQPATSSGNNDVNPFAVAATVTSQPGKGS